jgi:hypothetical protein
LELSDFFRPGELDRDPRNSRENHTKFVIGTDAVLAAPHRDVLAYADLSRWEIQQRQPGGEISNLGWDNFNTSAGEKYKRGFFVDWRVADRLKN